MGCLSQECGRRDNRGGLPGSQVRAVDGASSYRVSASGRICVGWLKGLI